MALAFGEHIELACEFIGKAKALEKLLGKNGVGQGDAVIDAETTGLGTEHDVQDAFAGVQSIEKRAADKADLFAQSQDIVFLITFAKDAQKTGGEVLEAAGDA